ncbi:MAG: gamma-glutamyltransferase [Pseudomonadota bacterium]
MDSSHAVKAPLWGLFVALLFFSGFVFSTEKPGKAAVATAHPLATEVGLQILEAGGNAFDAAVAISAVLAVVEPYSSGLGGGGFWLLHRAQDGFETMLDGREKAPLAAHRDLYLDAAGEVAPGLSINGPLAAGIPGEPAALVHISQHYGRLGLPQVLAPAIRLAREGFEVDALFQRLAGWRQEQLLQSADAQVIFLQQGAVPEAGTSIRQPDLATTLEALAKHGRDGFYRGRVAEQLVKGVREAGGIWSLEDLAEYRVMEREPVRGEYRGLRITSAAPPSSGGVVLVNMLNILAGFDLTDMQASARIHLIIEAMRRAYRDRADYLGDPDFVDIPLKKLTHPWYAAGLARDMRLGRATPSVGSAAEVGEGRDTSHFSVLDPEGNRVSATLSINYPFGSCFVPPGTGILLNDEMDDFSARPGAPNVYGLVGGEANAIQSGKRMLSSMTPTFVETPEGVAILGTPGGSRIITMILLGILELADGKGPAEWVKHPRFHHQYLPDQVQYEKASLSESVQQALSGMGHKLQPLEQSYGNMQAIFWNRKTGEVEAASDPRGIGQSEIRKISRTTPQELQ